MTLRFGTDGVRGVANAELTPELTVALGRAAARALPAGPVLIGRDTRRSGPLLESSLAAGFAAEGRDVELLGVVPTPAVAHLSASHDAVGVMISASHNPFPDNGIKLFLPGGRKLTDEAERALESELDRIVGSAPPADAPTGASVGDISWRHADLNHYVESVTATVDPTGFDRLSVVLDVGHGAAVEAAPAALNALGARTEVINDRPDGTNINDGCGSTDPSMLARRVVESGADAGLAFDGDADRLIAVDATGEVVDGDQILAVCAIDLRERGLLAGDTVVVTVMSNLGFHMAMEHSGIGVVTTAVGDRHVLDALDDGGYSLGGEQSGHLIFRRLATTGDGLLSGVQLLDVVARSGRPLAELATCMQRMPQVLRNVAVGSDATAVAERLVSEVDAVGAELGDSGRVLVRPSGTEPVLRVMVEATTLDVAEAAAARLVEAAQGLSG